MVNAKLQSILLLAIFLGKEDTVNCAAMVYPSSNTFASFLISQMVFLSVIQEQVGHQESDVYLERGTGKSNVDSNATGQSLEFRPLHSFECNFG